MPKGKILMGKTPKPVPGGKPTPGKKPITRGPVKSAPKSVRSAGDDLTTPGSRPPAKRNPLKPRPVKPVVPPKPKGGKVINRKIEDTKQKLNETVTEYSKYAPLSNKLGKTKPVVPPKPKGKNPPSVVYKKVETFKKNEARPYATALIPPRPEGVLKQAMPSFLRKTKPVTRRGGK